MRVAICWFICFCGIFLGVASIGLIVSRYFMLGLGLFFGAIMLVKTFGNPWVEDKEEDQ